MFIKKTIPLLLSAALITLPIFTACGDAKSSADENQADENVIAEVETQETLPAAESMIRQQVSGKDYGGYEFRVVGNTSSDGITGLVYNEVYYEEENGEPLQDSVYRRNQQTEDLLNCKIRLITQSEPEKSLRNSVIAGDDEYDAMLSSLMNQGSIAREGLIKNYYNIATMDLSNPWWDKNIVSNFTILGNKLYFLAGDINFRDDYAVAVIYFNKQLIENFGYDNPYDLVDSGKWTLDAMLYMVNGFTQDIDGDGKLDIKTDRYGFGDNTDIIKHLIFSMGSKITETDKDGIPRIAEMTESHIGKVEKLYNDICNNDNIFVGDNAPIVHAMLDSRCLFYYEMLGAYSLFRTMEDDFGIIPPPKYDEAQENYHAYVSNGWTSTYVVPITNPDFNRTGDILETMCAFSTDTIRATLYDVLFTVKYARDTQTARMIDYVVDSKVYDWSGDFGWLNDLTGCYTSLTNSKSFDFVSRIEKVEKKVNKTIEKMVEDFTAAD
ncbi:MAG: hypothetical protein GX897_09965 [Clostridiales bacterium]|nr:hypothetical protein [Clostridiales bacterium]